MSRAAAPRAGPDARPPARPRHPGPGGRLGPPEGRSSRAWQRVELRYVDLKAGRHLQVTAYDDTQAHTANHAVGEAARDAVDDLLDEPFGNWHVETTTAEPPGAGDQEARGAGAHHRARRARSRSTAATTATRSGCCPRTTRSSWRSASPTPQGRMKPSRQAKYRQVEEFLRLLDASITDAIDKGHLRRPTAEEPLRIVDLGCGNAYLTFAAQRFLTEVRGLPVRLTGVDVKRAVARPQRVGRRRARGRRGVRRRQHRRAPGSTPAPEVVLALHACDTATDEALARAVEWEAPAGAGRALLPPRHRRPAAPAAHARAVRHAHPARHPPRAVRRHPHRRAAGLAAAARRATASTSMQFVESQHTPRNTLLRAVRTGGPVKGGGVRKEYDDLVDRPGASSPRLAELLGGTPERADA